MYFYAPICGAIRKIFGLRILQISQNFSACGAEKGRNSVLGLPNLSKFSPAALKREENLLLGLRKFSKFSPAALKAKTYVYIGGCEWTWVDFSDSRIFQRKDLAFRNLGVSLGLQKFIKFKPAERKERDRATDLVITFRRHT